MSREITFESLKLDMEDIQRAATGFNRYPAPYTRVFLFENSTTRNMVQAIAENTDLAHEERPEFPNPPEYDLTLLDGDSGMFDTLKRAIQRAPRYIAPTPIVEEEI